MSFKVEVISLAFIELGQPPINSIETGNPIHAAAAQVYELILGNEFNSSQPWRFSMVLQQLSKSTEKPIIDKWENIFQLPTDPVFRMIYRLYISDGSGVGSFTDYDIYQDKIYSNQSELIIEYVSEPNDSLYPPSFKLMLVYRLAASIAYLVTQQASLNNIMTEKADRHTKIARGMDSKRVPNKRLRPGRSFLAHISGGLRGGDGFRNL